MLRPIECAALISLGLSGGLVNAAVQSTDPGVVGLTVVLGSLFVAVTVGLFTQAVVTYPAATEPAARRAVRGGEASARL